MPSDGSMKWEKPPLSLFAIPPVVGMFSAFVGSKIGAQFEFSDEATMQWAVLVLSWLSLIFISSLLMFTIPREWGNAKEMRLGVMAGVIIVFLPQILGLAIPFCALWILAVVLGWVFVSTYQWKYDVQPFRTGLWLGVGGLVGMFMVAFIIA